MSNKYDLPYEEIDTIQPINPETGAHNVALAYVQSFLAEKNFPISDEVDCDTIFDITNAYTDAYNYAYNLISHKNNLINQTE